jgi:hypothetical protein
MLDPAFTFADLTATIKQRLLPSPFYASLGPGKSRGRADAQAQPA